MWEVVYHLDAVEERNGLPVRERVAIENAVEKLKVLGPKLPYPHQSDVRGVERLRELRPRAGRSPWRAFYRRIGNAFVIAAIGPKAETNKRGFDRAVAAAEGRLAGIESEEKE